MGGEARKFITCEDLGKINTVEELRNLLRATFSDKYDYHNVLMNCRQRSDEKIGPYSVRLKVAARKCGFKDSQLDSMCVNYLKSSCAPYLKTLLNNCLPNTLYDAMVEHAIQFERTQKLNEVKEPTAEKKSTKQKFAQMKIHLLVSFANGNAK